MPIAAHAKIRTLAELHKLSEQELIESLQFGLPSGLVHELTELFAISLQEMAALLRLNTRTLQRRLEDGNLNLSESERVWELSRLFNRAVSVLENREAAVNWFKSPIQALGWATPLLYAQTAAGLRTLESLLGRIEHGVFS